MSAIIPTGTSIDVFISPRVESSSISLEFGRIMKENAKTADSDIPPMIMKKSGPLD